MALLTLIRIGGSQDGAVLSLHLFNVLCNLVDVPSDFFHLEKQERLEVSRTPAVSPVKPLPVTTQGWLEIAELLLDHSSWHLTLLDLTKGPLNPAPSFTQ